MSKIPSFFCAFLLLLLCAFNPPAHAGASTLGLEMERMALGPTYQWAASSSVSNRARKLPKSSLHPLRLRDKKKESHPAWLGFDKVLHFSFSAGLVGISYHGSRVALEKDHRTSQWMAGTGTGLLGLWKEKRDAHFSIGDLVADALGIAAGIVLFTVW
ncbi:MAG: hypothetical protein KAQ78_04400 [Candidatus Latescibacteria bacterium]|nr:hypothetical protein [Candidatus Latescibacterota bacterium]